MNQESKQNAMRQRHHERDFQIFAELALNGSHKRHDIVGTRRAYLIHAVDFPGAIQKPWIFFKKNKKNIKITRGKRALPQDAQWQEYNCTTPDLQSSMDGQLL